MTRTVTISSLHLEHKLFKNPREFTGLAGTQEFEELRASIKSEGLLDPPKVVKVKTGTNGSWLSLVWDGQRRVLAGELELGKEATIEVIDLHEDPIDLTPAVARDLMIKALHVGGKRQGLSSYELALVAEDLRKQDEKLSVIAHAIDKSESWVSKFLKAKANATPKQMFAWKKGEITDEQFKDLAAEKADDATTDAVVDARKKGNKAEARETVKEVAETAKQKRKRVKDEKIAAKEAAKEAKAKAKADALEKKKAEKADKKFSRAGGQQLALNGASTNHQPELPLAAAPAKAPAPPKKITPSKVTLEEMVSLSQKRPPTHDYVKGVLDGVRYVLGDLNAEDFGKPWAQYLTRLGGTAKTASPKKAKAKKSGSPKRSGKAIAKARKAKKRR